jgi:hypothetical protein
MTSMMNDWRDKLYEEVFEATCAQIEQRRTHDKAFGPADLRGLLETEYVALGNNWVGRGEVDEITRAATIAAYEHLLATWEAGGDAA